MDKTKVMDEHADVKADLVLENVIDTRAFPTELAIHGTPPAGEHPIDALFVEEPEPATERPPFKGPKIVVDSPGKRVGSIFNLGPAEAHRFLQREEAERKLRPKMTPAEFAGTAAKLSKAKAGAPFFAGQSRRERLADRSRARRALDAAAKEFQARRAAARARRARKEAEEAAAAQAGEQAAQEAARANAAEEAAELALPIQAATAGLVACFLFLAAFLPGCIGPGGQRGYIRADAIAAAQRAVIERHDAYVRADPDLLPAQRETFLATSEALSKITDAATQK